MANAQGCFFGINRIIQGRKDFVWVRLQSGAILAVFQNGLSFGESDKVLGFRIPSRVVMVSPHQLMLVGQ